MSEPPQGPVLDTKVRLKHLYADRQLITYGGKSIALAEAEWVAYWATRTTEKRFLSPTSYSNEWDFVVGRYPYPTGPKVSVHFYEGGRDKAAPEEWTFLSNLARHYVEPRLLNKVIAQISDDETVTVGGSLILSPDGIACRKPKFSVPWQLVDSARLHNGLIWIYADGAEKPLVTVPLSYPNAVLIPSLVNGLSASARRS